VPRVDTAFLQKAFGGAVTLANTPLTEDLDRRSGVEALVATHQGGKNYQVAVVRGNHKVLSQMPIGGKILAHANIVALGEFQTMDIFKDGRKIYLMPVDTLVYHRSVCGILAFRYRQDALSLIGEFSTKCWRTESGGDGSDPFTFFRIKQTGEEARIETEEPEGPRLYRWDKTQQAFLSIETLPGKSKGK
jgi:hypothetical protein